MTQSDAGRRFALAGSLLAAAFAVACEGATTVSPIREMTVARADARGTGNSDAALACQNGGYLTLNRSDGSAFKNVGDCVSYAAHGGVFGPVISSFESINHECTTATFLAVFSGGAGTVNGQPVTSGVPFTIQDVGPVVLVVTSPGGASVSATAPPVERTGSDCL